MEYLIKHASNQPLLVVIFVISIIIIALSIPYFLNQRKLYGSMIQFATPGRKASAAIACILFVGLGIYGFTPYVEPPSSEIAIVLGNTRNTPSPSISGDVSDSIASTMLMHKGEDISDLTDSIKIISATKQPEMVELNIKDLDLREIGNNAANAKRDTKLNIESIEKKLTNLAPTGNGANYFEAIIEATDNVEPGSTIIVIGSGLSDSGDLNFSKDNILTNEEARDKALSNIKEKYGSSELDDYNIEFYGLGDTVNPQEALSSIQKDVVRDIYKDAIKSIGGNPTIHTETQTGASVVTSFAVGTTDTGCGDIKLIFDDEDLKFVGDFATFIDETSAKKSLSSIQTVWNKQRDTIELIQIDGYTAHYPGASKLSQERADTVKKTLVDMGVSSDKIKATGRGYGPYETDAQNRTVNVNISRNNQQCSN